MATQHHGPFRPFRASVDMSGAGYRHRAVKVLAAGTMDRAAAGERSIGILTDAPKAGEAGSVQVYDQATAEAGAAFDAGVQLTPDATGRLVTAAVGDFVLATALEAASGAGHVVAVEVHPTGPVPA